MRQLNRYLAISTLLFTALTTEAVQLGSAKGSAFFGRPLDLSVQVRLDAPSEEVANCFSAEVFQADNKFDAGRVRLDVLASANGLDAIVRIRSITAVSEPWAKVILRSNCGAKVSRQYDFLTDFASDTDNNNTLAEAAPLQPQVTASASIVTSPLPLAPAIPTISGVKTSRAAGEIPVSNGSAKQLRAKAKSQELKSKTQIATLAPQQKVKPEFTAGVTAKNTTGMLANAVGQSRLKMETFALTDEHQVLLKLSTALIAPTGMRTPEEIQALAQATAVWRAINGMPAATPAAATVAPAEPTQSKAPAVATAPMPLPTLMNQKLSSKSELTNMVVYGLVGLLALTLGCIVWLWLRVRQATHSGYAWLNDSKTRESGEDREPTPFLDKNSSETSVQEDEKHALIDEPKTDPTPDLGSGIVNKVTTQEKTTQEEAVAEDLVQDIAKVQPITVPVAVTEKSSFNSLPDRFDDPRFDERVLRDKKKDRDLALEKPIVSSADLMDLVMDDTPPKLRSVSSPAPEPEPLEKPNVPAVTKTANSKDDGKSNLIDFDVFAEPEPLNKTTRFVR